LAKVRRGTVEMRDNQNVTRDLEIGRIMWANKNTRLPLMHGFDNVSVLIDMGSFWRSEGTKNCFFPSLHGLNELWESYPRATFVLFTRNGTDWAEATRSTSNLLKRLSRDCGDFGFPRSPSRADKRTDSDLRRWAEFYDVHSESIRTFAKNHPTMKYIEVDMETEEGDKMEELIGFPASCWI
jgi:hypothetical protein